MPPCIDVSCGGTNHETKRKGNRIYGKEWRQVAHSNDETVLLDEVEAPRRAAAVQVWRLL